MDEDRTKNWIDWGGDGPLLHFAHANGFPPDTYRALIHELKADFHVVTASARPLWKGSDPASIRSWGDLAKDLTQELNKRGQRGIIGIGHSLGGAMTFLAAARDPGLFSIIVPIDPLMLVGIPSIFWGFAKILGLNNRLPLVQGAQARRVHWPDLKTARRSYRAKKIFSTWQPEIIDDYVAAAFRKSESGEYELRYPREWEARIFEISPANTLDRIAKITTPGLFIRGENSDTFLPGAVRKIPRINPRMEVKTISDTSHFVPMEAPERLSRAIVEYVARHIG